MNEKLFFLFFPFLFFFINYILISSTNSTLYFSFPTAIILQDKNIFIIHKTGVSVCDPKLEIIKKNVIDFYDDKQISEADLSTISISQFENGFIVSIIKNKIFIFDNTGNYKTNSSLNTENIAYYSLTTYKVEINSYYYFIAYIMNKKLHFLYYQYDLTNNNNNQLIKEEAYDRYLDYIYQKTREVENKGISCEFLKNRYYEDIITCLYTVYYSSSYHASIGYLYIESSSLYWKYDNAHFDGISLDFVRSSVTRDHSKALYCGYSNDGKPICILIDLLDNFNYLNWYTYDRNCVKTNYGVKVKFHSEIEEFTFSCFLEGGGIQIGTYNKDLTYAEDEFYRFTDCDYIKGYSVLFSYNTMDYYILSDANCNNINFTFKRLFYYYEEGEEEEEEEREEVEKGEEGEDGEEDEEEEEEEEKEKGEEK